MSEKTWVDIRNDWKEQNRRTDVSLFDFLESWYEPPVRRKDWIRDCAEEWWSAEHEKRAKTYTDTLEKYVSNLEAHIRKHAKEAQ